MREFETSGGAGEQRSGSDPSSLSFPRASAPWLTIFSAAVVALAAIWLYRRALTFAYFNDDPTGHFAWMEGRTLLQFFTSSADYGYYRPVVFAVLRFSELLFGNETLPHNPVADHALLLLLHGANTAMVWLLARRLSGVAAFAWVAASVFAFVPFSYEAVAYVASLTHPLLVFWTLLALLLYDRGRDSRYEIRQTRSEGRRATNDEGHRPPAGRYRLLALLAMTLGLLTHENGLFIFPALTGLDWVMWPQVNWRERTRALWPFVVPPVLYVILWLAISKNSDQGLNSLADIGRNTIPFLQTHVYPLLPAARFDSNDVGPLVMLAIGVVAIFGLLAWRAHALRLWAFALGWFALSALPALLFLGPAYVYGSPRLSYLPSVGAALLWAIPALWLWSSVAGRPSPVVRILLTIAYILAILLPPLPFIRCQLDFYNETSRFAREMGLAGSSAPAGRDVVFINAPFFFSSTAARPDGCPSAYPWTPVGGILIPPYAQARDFVRFNGGPDRVVAGVTYSGYRPGWRTFGPEIDGETLRRHAAEDAAYVFDLLGGTFANLSVHWQPGAAENETGMATFGNTLALADGQLSTVADWLAIGLDWRVIDEPEAPLAAFVHIYDVGGALVGQNDGPLGNSLVPQDLWQSGDGLRDERRIDLSTLPAGAYRVVAGVYQTTAGARLAANVGGQPLADDMYTLGLIEK